MRLASLVVVFFAAHISAHSWISCTDYRYILLMATLLNLDMELQTLPTIMTRLSALDIHVIGKLWLVRLA